MLSKKISRNRCCVPGCKQTPSTPSILHNFPNPHRDRERFLSWVLFIGGEILDLDNEYIYKNRRVCDSHFEEKYFGRNNRILKNSVPRLNLPVKKAAEKSTDIPKCKKNYVRSRNNDDKSLNNNISPIQNASSTLLEEESLDDFSMRPMGEQINGESLGSHSLNMIEERIKEESSDTQFSALIEEKIEEESSNNYPLRLIENHIKEEPSNNYSSRLTEEYIKEELSNNSSSRLTEEYIKEEPSDTHFSVPIEEKLEEESSNNYSLSLIEEHVEEELWNNRSSSSNDPKNDDFSLLQIREDCALQYFHKLLTEKNSHTLRNGVFGILLAYEMEKVAPRKKSECFNALKATMEKYIKKE